MADDFRSSDPSIQAQIVAMQNKAVAQSSFATPQQGQQQQTVQQAQANPGTVVTGPQTGFTPGGQLPVQQVNFQAMTTTPESRRAAAIPEVARMNNISLEEAAARYDRSMNPPVSQPPGTVYNPATGKITDPRTGAEYVGSTGPDYSGLRFMDTSGAPQSLQTGLGGAQGVGGQEGGGGASGGNTSVPGGSIEDQLTSINKQTDEAYESYKKSMEQLQAGTLPLNAEEQAQIQLIQAQFAQMADAQKAANERYQRGLTQAGISAGRSRYAPEVQMGILKKAVDDGLAKVKNTEIQALSAIADYKQGVAEKNYKLINESYDRMTEQLEKKQKSILDIQKAVLDHQEKMAELDAKMEQDQIMNTLKFAEFDQKQKRQAFENMMTSEKFDWQQKQDGIKNMIDSDKFSWQQKQDMIKNALEDNKFALEGAKFSQQQEKDLRNYQLELDKFAYSDNKLAHDDWVASGMREPYTEFLRKYKNDAKPPTADQEKAAGFTMRVKASNDIIGSLTKQFEQKGYFGQNWQKLAPNFLKSSEGQMMEQAQRDFVNAVLRRESGAAISPGEFDNAGLQYFPQPGDKPEVIAQKAANRKIALEGLVKSSGSALSDDFKQTALSNRRTYNSLDDYALDNPDAVEAIDKIGQEHPEWSDTDILQILQSNGDEEGARDFKQPLSMGEKGLGNLSERFESGGNPGAIGYDTTGGFSYGKYQLAHNNAKDFIEQSPYASEFKGLAFNSPAWRDKWKEIAQKDPEGFGETQKEYIGKTHFEPQVQKLASAGIDLSKYSPILKDVIWSTAVQHGPGTGLVLQAFKSLGKKASEANLLKKIYDLRWSGGKQFAGSTQAVKNSVYNRFFGKQGELNTALKNLNQYG